MLITLTEESLGSLVDEGSVVVFTGRDDSGRAVTFAVEHRVVDDLIAGILNEGDIQVEAEGWQVIEVRQP